jgi:aminoglycoside phosphotransferase (APT) family kinase protein
MPTPLDIEQPGALAAYLHTAGRVSADEQVCVERLAGGVSNRTMLVRRTAGPDWVVKQALPQLRVAVEWFSDPRRIEREAAGMRWLAALAPPGAIAPLVFEDRPHHLLAMEAVPQPHENWKTVLLSGRLDAGHVRSFAELLAAIHRRAFERQAEIAAEFDDRSFFESLRLEPYYAFAAEHVPSAAEFLHRLIHETRATRLTLVHGDYSPKNVLIYAGRLVLLDHEVIHFGDPAFDLGFSLAHLLSKAHHVARLRGEFAAAAEDYWRQYRDALGPLPWAAELEPRAVRHTLGCLLARVAGRSPLEYLDAAARARQRDAVLALLDCPPTTVAGLAAAFIERLPSHAEDR